MVRYTLLTLVLALSGCTDDFWNTDDTEETDFYIPGEGCPTHYLPASSASVQVSNFLLDGAGRTIGFSASATEDGQPAACVRSDTREAEVLLFYGQIPYMWVGFYTPEVGSFTVGLDSAAVQVEIFGEPDTLQFTNGNWESGTWSVYNNDSVLDGAIVNAYGISDGQSVSFSMNYQLTP
jgi:hypothetical protein